MKNYYDKVKPPLIGGLFVIFFCGFVGVVFFVPTLPTLGVMVCILVRNLGPTLFKTDFSFISGESFIDQERSLHI